MPKYPDSYFLTRQKIDELCTDAKQASKLLAPLFKLSKQGYYSYRVEWSVEDGQYIGLCNEFPLLSWLDSDSEKARLGIEKLVSEVVIDMASNGKNNSLK